MTTNKHRVYACPNCGGECHRPLTQDVCPVMPFPKPCDACGRELCGEEYSIVDDLRDAERLIRKFGNAGTKKKGGGIKLRDLEGRLTLNGFHQPRPA